MAMTGEFRGGWKVVVAASLGVATGLSPLPFYTIGVFVAPLHAAFGWAVDQILLSLIITTLCVLMCGPIVGMLTDRYGVRSIVLGSTTLFGLCFTLFAFNPGSLPLFYATYALLAIVGVGTLPITWTRAINSRFRKHRGLALGLALLPTGIFGIVAKLYAGWLIAHGGWRMAYAGLALFPLLLALPAAFAFLHNPDEPLKTGQAPPPPELGLSLANAMTTRRFWTIAAALFLMMLPLGGIVPNLEPMLMSKGFSAGTAVALAGIIGIAVLVARPISGWLADHFWAPGVAFVFLLLPAASFLILSHLALTFPLAALSVFLIGVALGVEYDIVAYLVSRYFGLRAYSSIYGSLYVAFALGSGSGPYIIGRVFIAQHSYDGVMTLGAVAVVIGSALLLTLGRYPDFDKTDEAEDVVAASGCLGAACID